MKNYRLKNYLKIGMILVGISIFLWNCQKEDIANPSSLHQENQEIKSIQQKFTLENYQDSFIKNNLKVDWSNFVYSSSMNANIIKSNLDNPDNDLVDDNFVTYEFSTNLNSKVSSIKDTTYFYSKKSLLAFIDKRNNSITLRIINYSSYINNDLDHINLNSLKNFIGTITLFDLKGKSLKVDAYNSGELLESFKIPNDDKNLGHMEPVVGDNPCTGCWQVELVRHYTDWFRGTTDPVTGITTYSYVRSSYEGTTYEWTYIPSSNYSSGSPEYHDHAHGPHAPDTHIDYHPEEIIIDTSFINTKAECVFNKLQNLSSGFKNAIKKFDGEFPVAHLKMSIDSNLPNTTNAVTSNNGTYIIEIKINGNTLPNRTILGLARTLIHEVIHAEMYRKLRSVNYTVSINDFPGIFYYYSTYNNWQHQQMASHYRNTIVDILKEFDNNQHSDSFYNDLAWEGLQGTVAWDELPNTEKSRIISVVNDYKNNGNKNCN